MITIGEIYKTYKNIIGWGCGKYFQENYTGFLEHTESYGIRLKYIIDNNELLQGDKIYNINICSPKSLYNEKENETLIIIFSSFSKEILNQLELMDVKCKVILLSDIYELNEVKEIYKFSYSQNGEDIIIKNLFDYVLKVYNPTYLDIGANHPFINNNTYNFYKNGSTGVLIEPDIELHDYLKVARPKDVCLNIGIGINSTPYIEFYKMDDKCLSTFSKDQVKFLVNECNYRMDRAEKIPMLNINHVIEKNFTKCPNFISLDTEGMDLDILKSFDFDKYTPEVFCVETITFSKEGKGEKVYDIISYMESKGYLIWADTHVNTIFVSKSAL